MAIEANKDSSNNEETRELVIKSNHVITELSSTGRKLDIFDYKSSKWKKDMTPFQAH